MADLTTLGPYQVIELVRRGRSADSYLAHHARMRLKRVLLRVLHEDEAADEAFLRDFIADARAAAKLQNNCIASVIDLESESRPVYAVLEFIEGMDLAAMLEAFGPAPPEVAASIAIEVCRGLAYAHEAEVVHRRLRPRLIKVTPEGGVKILGFGVREKASGLQPTAMISDVSHEEMFRSPEQVREEPEGPAGDLYSLGVILYELLTGQMPYGNLAEYVTAEAAGRATPRVRDRNPLVTARLAALVERMMSPAVADRPADAGEVRRELEALLEERGDSPGPDLVQAYVGNPPDYMISARRRMIADIMERASQLSRGHAADRVEALHELNLLLMAEPGYAAAQALARKLRGSIPAAPPEPAKPATPGAGPAARPASSDDDLDRTRILPPPGEEDDDPLRTRVLPAAPTRRPPGPSAAPRPTEPAPAPPRAAPAPPPPPRPAPRPAPAQLAPAPRPKPGPGRMAGVIALAAVAVLAAVGSVVLARGCRHEDETVAEAPATPSPPPAAATGSLRVSSRPAGARVVLADAHLAFTTDTTLASVAAGSHAVHVEKDGFAPRDTSVTIVAGQQARLAVDLVAAVAAVAPCSLFVQVTPRADRVLVDSVQAGGGPALFWRSVAAGKHKVVVQAAGSTDVIQRVAVPAHAARQTIYVTLQAGPAPPAPTTGTEPGAPPATASPASGPTTPLELTVKPASDVFLDEARAATHVTNATLNLTAGEHTIRVENPDYASNSRSVKAQVGPKAKPLKLKIDLTEGRRGLYVTGPRGNLRIYLDDQSTGKTTPDQVMASAGAHVVSVREANGTTIVASTRVIVDPSKLGNQNVVFKP